LRSRGSNRSFSFRSKNRRQELLLQTKKQEQQLLLRSRSRSRSSFLGRLSARKEAGVKPGRGQGLIIKSILVNKKRNKIRKRRPMQWTDI